MKKITFLLGVATIGTLFLSSCGGGTETIEKAIPLATLSANGEDTLIDKNTRIEGGAHGGNFSFRTDSAHQYAGSQTYKLNDSLVNKPIRVIVNFWAKTNTPLKGDALAISFQDDNAMIYWGTFEPFMYGIKANEWINVVDSVTIPASQNNKPGLFFKFFAYNHNKTATFDLDDINISVKEIETVIAE